LKLDKPYILCVDDAPAVLRTTELVLRAAHYAVSTADAAEESVRHLTSKHFDLILLDCIPEYESVVQDAKRIDPDVRIVVFTWNPALRNVPFVDLVLHKPIPPPVLLNEIAELLCARAALVTA
jgi:CheY-like chemotaxis protein